jgi:hypothetical protein
MDNIKQPNRAKYKGKTYRETSFEDWWKMVVECYKEGFLDCPSIGRDTKRNYDWWTPSEEQIERFRTDPLVKMQYARECYMAGDDPGSALDSMD